MKKIPVTDLADLLPNSCIDYYLAVVNACDSIPNQYVNLHAKDDSTISHFAIKLQ